MISICFINGDIYLDPLVKVVSAKCFHCKVTVLIKRSPEKQTNKVCVCVCVCPSVKLDAACACFIKGAQIWRLDYYLQ